jgi:hypothetical protein
MLDEELSSKLIDQEHYATEIAQQYTKFLSRYPEIFSDLDEGSVFDFALYETLESYDKGSNMDVFHVLRSQNGIEIKPGNAKGADLELSLSVGAVEKLIKTQNKEDYSQLLGSFYNDPDEENGWIDFTLHKRTQVLIDMGYGRFAQTAGILEEDDEIYRI